MVAAQQHSVKCEIGSNVEPHGVTATPAMLVLPEDVPYFMQDDCLGAVERQVIHKVGVVFKDPPIGCHGCNVAGLYNLPTGKDNGDRDGFFAPDPLHCFTDLLGSG